MKRLVEQLKCFDKLVILIELLMIVEIELSCGSVGTSNNRFRVLLGSETSVRTTSKSGNAICFIYHVKSLFIFSCNLHLV